MLDAYGSGLYPNDDSYSPRNRECTVMPISLPKLLSICVLAYVVFDARSGWSDDAFSQRLEQYRAEKQTLLRKLKVDIEQLIQSVESLGDVDTAESWRAELDQMLADEGFVISPDVPGKLELSEAIGIYEQRLIEIDRLDTSILREDKRKEIQDWLANNLSKAPIKIEFPILDIRPADRARNYRIEVGRALTDLGSTVSPSTANYVIFRLSETQARRINTDWKVEAVGKPEVLRAGSINRDADIVLYRCPRDSQSRERSRDETLTIAIRRPRTRLVPPE